MLQELRRKSREFHLEEHVTILGRVDSSVKDSALEACDLVLFPSRDEPYGLVPLEALAYGKPVLVSLHSGVAELLENSTLTFDPGQTQLAAQRINEILDKPGLANQLVKEASELIKSVPVEKTDAVYEELSMKVGSRVL